MDTETRELLTQIQNIVQDWMEADDTSDDVFDPTNLEELAANLDKLESWWDDEVTDAWNRGYDDGYVEGTNDAHSDQGIWVEPKRIDGNYLGGWEVTMYRTELYGLQYDALSRAEDLRKAVA